MADKGQLIRELKQRLAKLEPLEDEPDFFSSEETLVRFLKSREWKLEEAEKMLVETVEYRRRTHPLRVDCSWCHSRPGYHSMRQVGHDEAGRPVIYANFAQASTHKNSAEDTVCHVTHLIENAKRTMAPGICTWVFVIDCTGMTLSSCNPKLGYSVTNVLAQHYPERLGLVICVNHSPVFHGVWKAIKQFLHPQTAAKVKLVRSKAKIAEVFSKHFGPELTAWLKDEMALNKQKPIPIGQLEFWNPPPPGSKSSHDPRGCPAYVAEYLDTFKRLCFKERGSQADGKANGKAAAKASLSPDVPTAATEAVATANGKMAAPGDDTADGLPHSKAAGKGDVKPAAHIDLKHDGKSDIKADVQSPPNHFTYLPHPNITDSLRGLVVRCVSLTPEEEREREQAQKMVESKVREVGRAGVEEDVDGGAAAGGSDHELEIPSELQIPATARPLSASS